jgi:protease-4
MIKLIFKISGAIASFCVALLFFVFTIVIVKKALFSSDPTKKGHVAVIDLAGMILTSEGFLKNLEEHLEHKGLKAIVLRVNSPGGLVAPSQEIYEAIRKADQKVPVLVSMASLAASGGYYAALGGRKIYANPGTLTASIGVIMEFANTQKLYQWAKVDRFTIKSGKFKDIGSPLREMRPDERALLQGMATNIHDQFKKAVKERRKMDAKDVDEYADGRVMTGEQAQKVKLVDELKTLDEVILEAKKLGGLTEKDPVIYPEGKGLLRKILEGEEASTDLGVLGQALGLLTPSKATLQPSWRLLLVAPISN